jgi:hypothetical protein
MSDEPANPEPGTRKKRARSARAFTSLLLGIFGILLGGGAALLHHWHKHPPSFMQVGKPAQKSEPNPNAPLQELLQQKTKAPLQRGLSSTLLGFSTGMAVLGGIIGAIGLIMGVLSLRLDDTERGKAWSGTLLSFIAILAWGLAGWNVILDIRLKQQAINDIGKEFANYTNILDKAFNMADDLLPGVRAGQDTVIFESEWRGKKAPDLRVQPVNPRGDVLLSEQRDVRPVLLVILNTQSVSCQPVIDLLKELHRDIPASDLLILAVSHREEPAVLTAAVQAQDIRFLTGKADSPVEPYKDALSPTVFAIDHTGVIRKALVGNDAGKADILRAIARGLVDSAKRR